MSESTDQERWKQLQVRLKEAHTALKANEHHDLTFPYVMRILATFGPRLHIPLVESEQAHFEQAALRGWQRRAWNALLCAEKVLPLWTRVSPVPLYMSPSDILNQAKKIVRMGTPPSRKWNVVLIPDSDGINTRFPYHESTPQIACAVTAHFVIEHALGTIRNDIDEEFNLNLSYADESMGCDSWQSPTAIYASWAVGGIEGFPNYPFLDDQARGEFWLWWLNEAVPASWDLKDI